MSMKHNHPVAKKEYMAIFGKSPEQGPSVYDAGGCIFAHAPGTEFNDIYFWVDTEQIQLEISQVLKQ